MLRNHSRGVSDRVFIVLLAAWAAVGCGSGESQSPVKPAPDAGGAQTQTVKGTVSGGTVMRSSRYRLIGSMSPGVADGTVGVSPQFVARTGLVGASQ